MCRAPPIPFPRQAASAAKLNDRVVVCGGNDGLFERYLLDLITLQRCVFKNIEGNIGFILPIILLLHLTDPNAFIIYQQQIDGFKENLYHHSIIYQMQLTGSSR